jgi:small-conductance mechanosensitive channel
MGELDSDEIGVNKFSVQNIKSKYLRNSIRILATLLIISIIFSGLPITQLGNADPDYVSTVNGYVWDEAIHGPGEDFLVEIEGETFLGNSTLTNQTGYYEINLPQTIGELTITISKNKNVYKTFNFTIQPDDRLRLDFTINTTPEEEEPEEDFFKYFTLEQIVSDVIENWWALIFVILLLVITPILMSFVDKFSKVVDHRKYALLDEKSVEFIEKILRYNLYIAFVILLIMFLAWLFPGINEHIWKEVSTHVAAIYTIVFLVIIMRLLLLILNTGMDYLRGNLTKKPKLKVSKRYIGILEIVLKYLILLIFGINILVIALAIFGMGDLIADSVSGFLGKNSGYIVFIILVIVIVYFVSRFMRTFITDLKRKETTKLSPQVADMVGKVGKIVVYIFGAMIIMFALLQMANMGDLGQTLILMISMIIGFVVAMAATGSIGNVLSGVMLNAFRPFEIGDRVKIGDEIGDVVSTNLAFVRLETLNSEIIEIPNNTVIADKLLNYSRSGSFAVTVDVGIGYNVPTELVRKLLLDAARETKDIEDNPRPHVLVMNLGDYAVTYRLKPYTTNAKAMVRIKSNLMANVHKCFYTHGVEILSPWYLVKREGKTPSEKEIMDGWETVQKKGEEAITKETEEKIGGGFDLMDKAIESEPKKIPEVLKKIK